MPPTPIPAMFNFSLGGVCPSAPTTRPGTMEKAAAEIPPVDEDGVLKRLAEEPDAEWVGSLACTEAPVVVPAIFMGLGVLVAVAVVGMLSFESTLNLLIPSGSGQAAVTIGAPPVNIVTVGTGATTLGGIINVPDTGLVYAGAVELTDNVTFQPTGTNGSLVFSSTVATDGADAWTIFLSNGFGGRPSTTTCICGPLKAEQTCARD